jgi:NitT/TauT family transport system ATP-binding protein
VTVLCLSAVAKTFPDGTDVLRDVSIDIRPGELVAIVGPSGCGKSTLLRISAGLETPSSGRVQRSETRMSVVFQDHALMPWRTVHRNVALFAELAGDTERLDERVRTAVARTGLVDAIDKFPRQLSGGMKMRASLARALVTEPRLLLLDEPFGALDQLTRMQLQEDFVALRQRQNFAGMLITHSIDEAVYLSDRIVVLGPRPASIVSVIDVPFGRHRDAALRYDTDFARVCGIVARSLGMLR